MAYSCLDSVDFSSAACGVFNSDFGGVDGTAIEIADIGLVQNATTPLENLGTLTTKGVDFALDYFWDINWLGANTLDLTFAGTWLDTFEKDFGELGTIEYAGTAGGIYGVAVYPEWSVNSNLSLQGNHWSVSWRMRWLDETEDLYRPDNITDDGIAEDILYHDLTATLTIDKYDLTVGVDNVTDEEPPLFHSGFEYHTAPGVYDTIGRYFWFKVSANF
jgi:iron complex outermembrane receptor protein